MKMYYEVEKGTVLYFLTYQVAMEEQLAPMAGCMPLRHLPLQLQQRRTQTGYAGGRGLLDRAQPVVADLSRRDGDLQPEEEVLSEGWSELSSV